MSSLEYMPEGPEVETIRLGLRPVLGKEIVLARVTDHKFYLHLKEDILNLRGMVIEEIKRRGKFLVWYFDGSKRNAALNHLGMTGVWHLYSNEKWEGFENPFNHFDHWKVYFRLSDGSHLLFVNVRTFGKFEVMYPEEIESYPAIKQLGPDILDLPFQVEEFIARIRGSHGRPRTKEIGKCLLDYSIVAGCGNIYKSESLFRAKINPMRSAGSLSKKELRVLGQCLSQVGQESLKLKGATLRDYQHVNGYSGLMQNKFLVYDREGEKCVACTTIIQAEKQGGRTTFWCPTCQPA